MNRLIFLLSLNPIIYGLIGIIVSGISFPLAGVIILRNNLIPMRYMLMHGVILGGIISIAFGLPIMAVAIPLNILLVFFMMLMNKRGHELSSASTAMMVLTMGLASLLSHLSDIPSKDTLEVLWGSPFALTEYDLIVLVFLSVLIVAYVCIFFRPLSIVFFDPDIASSLGVNVKLHNTVMVLFTALIISAAMKVIGALLIDALVVLPVVSVSKNAKSLKQMFVKSSVTGLILSIVGYFVSLLWNLPVSGVLAVLACIVFAFNLIMEKIGKHI